jgi:hypothetical protein
LGTWHAPPRSRRYAPLSGAAKYPVGARPSKCIILSFIIIRAEREKRQAEENLAEEIKLNSTSVTYDGEEFVTTKFTLDDWNKSTQRRFARWVQSWSELTRPFQRIVDQSTNEEFTGIKGKTLVLLHPDEEWKSGQVVLKYKPGRRSLAQHPGSPRQNPDRRKTRNPLRR